MKDQREINQRIIKRLQQESEPDNNAILYLIAVLAFIFFINALLNAF